MTDETPVPAPADDTVALETDSVEADDSDPANPAAARRRVTPLTVALIATAGVLVVVLVVVLVIAAAANSGTPMPTPSTPSASPSPSASAEPVHVEPPQPVLALSCDALVSASVLAGVNPASTRAVVADDDFSIELAQAGGTECSWNNAGVSRSYDDRVFVSVLPGGESSYLSFFGGMPDDLYTLVDTAGDHSMISCNAWGGSGSCQAHLTARGHWITVSVNRSSGTVEKEQLDIPMQALLDHMAAAVRSAPADRPVPKPMPGAFTGERLCADGATLAESAFGWSGLQASDLDGGSWITAYAFNRVGVDHCAFTADPRYVQFSILQSGAWSVDQMVARLPFDGWRGAWSQVEVTGADAALVACNANDCEATISYRFSRIQIWASGIDRASFVAGLPRLITALG